MTQPETSSAPLFERRGIADFPDIAIERLIEWLDGSPCNFLAVQSVEMALSEAGFVQLDLSLPLEIVPGGKYYVKRNDSAIFPFIVGTASPGDAGFQIIAAHTDSPALKLKPNPEIIGDGGVVSLNVEKYGGGILYTWFDRPLSLAGRAMLRISNSGAGVGEGHPVMADDVIFDLHRPIAIIPHLAIHFNRGVNEGNPLSVQKDMKPVLGIFTPEEIAESKAHGGIVKGMVARYLGVTPEDILSLELNLYPLEDAVLSGLHDEFISSGRLDDLSMAFAGLEALMESAATPNEATRILALFDNEETGSGTRQGAAAPTLRHLIHRITLAHPATNPGEEDAFFRALEHSFLISADDAHAWHPNYNEKYDPTNHPVVGGGPVVKINANCKYMTDSRGDAIFTLLCEKAGVGCQHFVNHADVAGGSTLGNILTSQLDIAGVDMGCAIWAMHSARETGSTSDYISTVKVFREFYTSTIML